MSSELDEEGPGHALPVGELHPAFLGRSEPERRALWRAAGGRALPGPVGRVRRLGRLVPRDGHPLPFRIPFIFTMDGRGLYFGDDADGLWRIFGGQSRVTRLLWGRLFMGGKAQMLVADVALGRTSLIRELDPREAFLHHLVGWVRPPLLTPARFYFGWRRRALRLDTYEVHGVKFLPRHGHYTVVTDLRRVIWRGVFDSLDAYRDSLRLSS